MLDYVLVLVWYVRRLLLLPSTPSANYFNFLKGWSPFFGAYTPRIASHALSQRKSNLNSLRYHLGRRDILPPERRQRRRVEDVDGHGGRNRPKGLFSLGTVFRNILRQLRLPAFPDLLALGRRSPKSPRKHPADCCELLRPVPD